MNYLESLKKISDLVDINNVDDEDIKLALN